MNLLKDKQIRAIEWRDLTQLSFRETFIENTVSLPWLLLSWLCAYYHLYFLALPCSFLFFLTGLRLVHNAYHNTLGISKQGTWLMLALHSIMMLASMHAIRHNHLRHHKYFLHEEDIEGCTAKMSAWQAILYGPVFIFRMHRCAWQTGSDKMVKNVIFELCTIAMLMVSALILDIGFLKYHIVVMIIGEFMTGFFAVWTVHHGCDESNVARTMRNGWKNFFSYNMFYHLEHHLFPQVPTIKLPNLAERLDKQIPDLRKKTVF